MGMGAYLGYGENGGFSIFAKKKKLKKVVCSELIFLNGFVNDMDS